MKLPGQEDIWNHLDSLTKPVRSLGRLEDLAARLCEIQQTLSPRTTPRRVVLFAADHGVAASGVSIWPADVTRLMIGNIRGGGAASSVLARQTQTELTLVDVGSLGGDLADEGRSNGPSAGVRFRSCRVRPGTRDLSREPALTVDEFERAFQVGREEARSAAADGMRVLATGEMGIGNTTPTACLAMLLADVPLAAAVGRGAGADDATLERKRRIVGQAVNEARRLWTGNPPAAIAAVAGLEIAAMAGFFAEAHAAGLTVLLDGYVTGAAALVAEHLVPGTARSMIAAHLSAEPGHRIVLERLGLESFLDWNMRLGEGTGALLLMPLLDAAAAMTNHMARLQDLGISRKAAVNETDHALSPVEGGLATDCPHAEFRRWREFVTAVQFLTRIPLSIGAPPAATTLARCRVFFPLVGALIGVFTAAVAGLGVLMWPPWLAVLLALAGEAVLTGAMHEDGVADFCDAFGGGRTREQALAIFKDSRIGAFGAMGLLLAFSLRAGAMTTLIDHWGVAGWPRWGSAFVASSAVGRYAMVVAMALVPPIAGRESLARTVDGTLSGWDWVAISAWVSLAMTPFVVFSPFQFLVAGLMLLPAVGGLLLLVRRKLGGTTGDCLGCLGYIAQVTVLLAAAAGKQPWGPRF